MSNPFDYSYRDMMDEQERVKRMRRQDRWFVIALSAAAVFGVVMIIWRSE